MRLISSSQWVKPFCSELEKAAAVINRMAATRKTVLRGSIAGWDLIRSALRGDQKQSTLRNKKRRMKDHGALPSLLLKMGKIGAIGFEPTASRSRTERTTRLCYAPTYPTYKKSIETSEAVMISLKSFLKEIMAPRQICEDKAAGLYHPAAEYSIKGANRPPPDQPRQQSARWWEVEHFHDGTGTLESEGPLP